MNHNQRDAGNPVWPCGASCAALILAHGGDSDLSPALAWRDFFDMLDSMNDNEQTGQGEEEAPAEMVAPEQTDAPAGDQTAQTESSAEESEASPQAQVDLRDVASAVEAVLFSTDVALPASRIAQVVEAPQRLVKQAIAMLNDRYDGCGSAFRIEAIAGGYQMLTLPRHHDVLARLVQARSESKLSQAAMETLAIIAYRQPMLRADVEAIRGVASGEVLRGLMEKNLVKIVGRAEVLGRPMLYGTTKRFLEVFGLADLQDLPRVEELRAGAEKKPEAKPDAKPEAKPEAQAPGPDHEDQ
jgi:segregation and condensation protein B